MKIIFTRWPRDATLQHGLANLKIKIYFCITSHVRTYKYTLTIFLCCSSYTIARGFYILILIIIIFYIFWLAFEYIFNLNDDDDDDGNDIERNEL